MYVRNIQWQCSCVRRGDLTCLDWHDTSWHPIHTEPFNKANPCSPCPSNDDVNWPFLYFSISASNSLHSARPYQACHAGSACPQKESCRQMRLLKRAFFLVLSPRLHRFQYWRCTSHSQCALPANFVLLADPVLHRHDVVLDAGPSYTPLQLKPVGTNGKQSLQDSSAHSLKSS